MNNTVVETLQKHGVRLQGFENFFCIPGKFSSFIFINEQVEFLEVPVISRNYDLTSFEMFMLTLSLFTFKLK